MKAFMNRLELPRPHSMPAGIKIRAAVASSAAFLLVCSISPADTRSSEDYTILTDTVDADGGRGTSVDYTNDGAAGGVTGITTSTSGEVLLKAGYIGQLYEINELVIGAPSTSMNESATTQLEAHQLLDDDTIFTLAASDVIWSVQSGPLTGISPSGLATASTVYQNTAATAQGSYGELTGTLDLTVLDTIPDNFGSYAGDGLADDWQFQFFGQDNPLAAPLLDPDGDDQNNAFEHTAGLNPTNPLSRFLVTIAPVPGQPAQKQISFEPVVPGRTYTVLTSPDLTTGSWEALTGGSTSDDGDQRSIIDPAAGAPRKFYQVEIEKQ